MLRTLSSCLVCLLSLASIQEEVGERVPDVIESPYPARRMETRVQYVAATGEIKVDKIHAALEKLGGELGYGPASNPSRSSNTVFGVTLPADLEPKDAKRAIKKGGRKPEVLFASALEFVRPGGGPVDLASLFGGEATRGTLLGMTSEMRWVFVTGPVLTFLYEPGRMKSDELLSRVKTAAKPYIDGPFDVRYLRDEILWVLQGSIDAKAAKKLEKALLKHDGVVEVVVDGPLARVKLVVAFDQLETTGEWLPLARFSETAGQGDGDTGPEKRRPTYFVNPLLDAITGAGLELPE